jgi:hypothetical protein
MSPGARSGPRRDVQVKAGPSGEDHLFLLRYALSAGGRSGRRGCRCQYGIARFSFAHSCSASEPGGGGTSPLVIHMSRGV